MIFMSLCLYSYSQVVVWHESFEGTANGGTIASTSCTRTSVNTLANTDCIPANWKTGRLASGGSNQGHRWRATGNWPMPGQGSHALDLDMGAAEGGGLMSHGAALTAGVSYELTFYYRVAGTSGGGTYRILVGHTTNSGQSSNPTTQVASTGNTNQSWNLATYSFTPSTSGTYYIQLYATNSSTPTQRLIIDNMTLTENAPACTAPDQPGAITGTTTLCSGSSATYSVTNDPNATSYTWTLPSGWTGTSTSNSITVTTGSATGTISVTANNACNSSTAQTISVTVNTAPSQPAVINGSTNVCTGENNAYDVTNDPNATGYTWTLPSGWNGTSTANNITVTPGSNNGTISVTADNVCGSSTAQTISVTVNTTPSQPAAINGSTNVCAGENSIYDITNDPDATDYTWTLPSGWIGTSTVNNITVTSGTNSGIISVTANNSCGSSTPQTISVTIPTINNTVNLNGTTLTANESGASYQWFNCTDNSDIQGAASQSFTPTANGTYGVRITKGNCTETSACTAVNNLGLNNSDLINKITVYPNPASTTTNIQLSSVWNLGESTIQITDLTGRIVFSQAVHIQQGEHTFTIHTNELSGGIYNLELVTGNTILPLQKLIISNK